MDYRKNTHDPRSRISDLKCFHDKTLQSEIRDLEWGDFFQGSAGKVVGCRRSKPPGTLGREGPGGSMGRGEVVRRPASEEQDDVEADRELAAPGVVVVDLGPVGEIVPGFGADPEVRLGLVDRTEGEFAVVARRPGPDAVIVAEDFRPPDAGQLVVERVEEPVAEAVPLGVVAVEPVGVAQGEGDVGLPGLVGLEDLGQLVGPLVGEDGGEDVPVIAVVAGVALAGELRRGGGRRRSDRSGSGTPAGRSGTGSGPRRRSWPARSCRSRWWR